MKKVLFTIFIILFCIWGGIRIISAIQFDRNCGGYLKRAADANTVDLAKKQLYIALSYIEHEELTTGYTSILYRTPDEDVGFWYTNIKSSFSELEQVSSSTTQLERSNLLMKLRETLLDQGSEGKNMVTIPPGISIYPHNTIMAVFGWLSGILIIVGIIIVVPWEEF